MIGTSFLSQKKRLNISFLTKTIFILEFVLIAMLLTRRFLNVNTFGKTHKPIGKAHWNFKICEAGNHFILLVFDIENDAKRGLMNEPWSFDNKGILEVKSQEYGSCILTPLFNLGKKSVVSIQGMEVDNIGDIPLRPTTTDGVPLAALPSSSSDVVIQVDQENLNFKSILDTKYGEKHSNSLHR